MDTAKTISDRALRAEDPKAYFQMKNREMMWFLITGDTAVPADDHQVLLERCTGPNTHCKKEHRAGRSAHVISDSDRIWTHRRNRKPIPSLVLPNWHFATVEEGIAAVKQAWLTAVVVMVDEDLYAARAANVPYILRPGWVDPSRR
jgi:hypothetical protein